MDRDWIRTSHDHAEREQQVPIDFGLIKVDTAAVIRQLQQDLRDDWFPDPRRFEDMFKSNRIEKVIEANLQRNNGAYTPSARTVFNVPKKNFTLRYSLETGVADRTLYHALTAHLVPFYDPLLSWKVFSHRMSDKGGKYLFRKAIPAWKDFVGSVEFAAKEKGVLLSTDLANYFEGIDISLLKSTFLELLSEVSATPAEKGSIRAYLDALCSCLSTWCYDDGWGLPQNRDASSFLANMYLLPVDRTMLGLGYDYFRYMDDIKIACRDEFEARRALKELSIALRLRGLAVNSGKTVICSASEEDLDHCLDGGGVELQKLDGIWKTKSIDPIKRSLPLLRGMTEKMLRTGNVDGRAFRFCINRLEILAQCPELAAPSQYFEPITELVLQALHKYPAATDYFARYLRAAPTTNADLDTIAQYLQDRDKNFYTWQTYGLWRLLTEKNYRSDALLAFALEIVSTGEDNPNRAGATLYAGMMGTRDDRVRIAERFRSVQSFLGQRTTLIAVQELHYRPYIRDLIQPFLRPDLVGVYSDLDREGIYISKPEPTSITQIIDLEREYE